MFRNELEPRFVLTVHGTLAKRGACYGMRQSLSYPCQSVAVGLAKAAVLNPHLLVRSYSVAPW